MADNRIGTRIGDYLIEAVLGRGGMGVVYRGVRTSDGLPVALKLMLPELAANEEFRQRFMIEAEVAPFLNHPNIVEVYESGEVDGDLYIAMQLVEGHDLKALIKDKGRLDARYAMSLLTQAAAALDVAHTNGVVHRDVKPQNVMISPATEPGTKDAVFLTDFGLIRPVGSESTSSRTGQVFGSIQYMAPERIECLPDDGRSDVYSFACVAYECLTGLIPFDRPNEVGVMWAHIHEDPPRVTDTRPDLAAGVDDVIRRGMAKHPDQRYLTCGELVEALGEGLKRKQRSIVPAPLRPLVRRIPRLKTEREVWAPNFFPELSRVRREAEKVNWVQVAAVFSILSVSAAFVLQLTHQGGVAGAVSAVGSTVTRAVGGLLGADDEAPDAVGVRRKAERPRAGTVAISAKDGDRRASGAGRANSAASTQEHMQQPNLGSQANKSGKLPAAATPAPLNSIVFHVGREWWEGYAALFKMRGDGSRTRLLYNSPEDDLDPALSPDRTRVAFIRDRSLYVMDADGTNVKRLTVGSGSARHPSWSPDGSRLAYAHFSPVANWDLYVISSSGATVGLGNQITSGPASDQDPAWSPDGSTIAFTSDRGNDPPDLYLADTNGSNIRPFPTPASDSLQPAWSGDGRMIAYVAVTSKGDELQVTRFANDRCAFTGTIAERCIEETRVVDCRGNCRWPSWSPDDSRLLVNDVGTKRETRNLYSISLRTPRERRVVAPYVTADTRGDWR